MDCVYCDNRFCYVCCEDAENFEPRDVKPVPRDQWDGEDKEEVGDTAADVSMHSFHLRAIDAACCR